MFKLNLKNIKPDTLNPYYYSAYMLWDRLRWDLKIDSFISRNKLKTLKNTHLGEKAVIICNGPSLLKSDLSLLHGVYTFGLNKINLLFDKTDFRPSCIVAVNQYVIEQNIEFFNETSIPIFIDSSSSHLLKTRRNVCFVHTSLQQKFARDCSMSIYQGATVTFVAMQLAFHMGFKEVALIGCDHNFTSKGPANKLVQSSDGDKDHFDPNYFSGGVMWQLPDLALSECSYSMAKEAYELAGRKIFNATEGGKLEIFPRILLKEFLF